MGTTRENQDRLLKLILEYEHAKAERPKVRYLFLTLRREGIDYHETFKSLPWRYFVRDGSGGEEERVGLGLEGLAYLGEEPLIQAAFMSLLRLACRRFRENPREPAKVNQDDLKQLLGAVEPAFFERALRIVRSSFPHGGSYSERGWTAQSDVTILRYERAREVPDFVRLRDGSRSPIARFITEEQLSILKGNGKTWRETRHWQHFLEVLLAGPIPEIFEQLESISSTLMEKIDYNNGVDHPMRMTVDGLALTGEADTELADLVELVRLLAAFYETNLGEGSPTVDDLARQTRMPAERVEQLTELFQGAGLWSIRLDRSQKPWTFLLDSSILDYLGVRDFEDFYCRNIQAIRKANSMPAVTRDSLRMAFFELFGKLPADDSKSLNRTNLVGRPYQPGEVENHLKVRFTPEERALAIRSLRELEDSGLVIPTYRDVIAPADWLVLSQEGRAALALPAPISGKVATPATEFDAFLCHASEDKAAAVLPFAERMREAGLKPWIDKGEIGWGDDIAKRIQEGLSRSRFVIVFISASSVKKNWPDRELNAALSLEIAGAKKVLPVILGMSHEDLMKKYPLVAAKAYKSINPYDPAKPVIAATLDDLIQALQEALKKV
ncbi:MAG: toll/interleukin-1 receptor domain-containing protein [Planctomycetaceae bacterium]|nr:toll/interleukin-1 receptor domain-containing protein [Planctomycetaceae bacterium]